MAIESKFGMFAQNFAGDAAGMQETLMLVGLRLRIIVAAGLLMATWAAGASAATPLAPANRARIAANYGKLPLRFEVNRGQTDARVRFLSRGNGFGLYLTGQEAVLALRKPGVAGHADTTDVLRMQLTGANPRVEPMGSARLPGTTNYMLGNDAARWKTVVPSYGRVSYKGVYPGIDLVYYGNQQQLEYDFVVAAGADPRPIQLHFAGATKLNVDAGGNLLIDAEDGSIAFHKPMVYQMAGGKRFEVEGAFTLLGDRTVGFALGRYDHSRKLVIDPTLVYSTYLGGSTLDMISAIAVDSSGAAYVTGYTSSTNFPATPGALQSTDGDARYIGFVSKLNASGTALIYSTFLGGSGSPTGGDAGESIVVDSSGNAYISGRTYSSNFPVTTGAYQTTNKAFAGEGNTGFITKLNPTGTKLIYSTFLGGSLSDDAQSLVLDSSGNVYVAGVAFSKDFPVTAGVVQSTNKSAADYGWNEFVAKLNPAGSGLIYATYLGGSTDYEGGGVVRVGIDSLGDAFVSGNVYSTDFPVTAGAFQTKNNGKAGVDSNLTLAKLNPTATKLLYSTYIGGTGSSYHGDQAPGFAVDSAGNAYLTGPTYEMDYPVTSGAYQKTNKTGGSFPTIYVTKMNPAGTALVYSTYLGGSIFDLSGGLAVDSSGNAYITGSTRSTDFPTTSNAYQKTDPIGFNGVATAFLTELNTTGSGLVYSTYFGGQTSYDDTGYGVALGANGAVYFAGIATTPYFPISPGAYQSTFNSQNSETGFVAELQLGSAPNTLATAVKLTASANPAVAGSNITFSASIYPTTGTGILAGTVVYNIDQKDVATVAVNANGYADYTTTTPLAIGAHAILASYSGNATYSASGGNITENINSALPVISPPGGIYAAAQLIAITDATAGTVIYYTTDGTLPSSTPSSTSTSVKYSGPFVVSTTQVVSAIASLANTVDTAATTEVYKLDTAPTALAVPASGISTPKATLNGLVNSYGFAGTYSFLYGTSPSALTSSTLKTPLPSSGIGSRVSFVPMPVSTALTSLASKTTYYYQVVITTSGGTASGVVLSFTTN
jgi:hypothetical protein